MPPRPSVQPVSAFRHATRNPGMTLKERYATDPFGLADRFGLKFPKKPALVMVELGVLSEAEAIERFGNFAPGIREWVQDVLLDGERSSVVIGPRGGGKSQTVSFMEFVFFFIMEYDCLNLGGSELQADNVYAYLTAYAEDDPYWKTLLKGDMMKERTYGKNNNWIRVLAASQKSVRSPHAGGFRKVHGALIERGGLLVIDEEAEAEPAVVNAALPTINTARPSVSIRCSTFHNATGTFADVVDEHESMGYKLYQWDIFDIMEKCACVGQCQSTEPCFAKDHVDKVYNPETGETDEHLRHKAYCGGRGMYADGWIPVSEVEALWKRMKRNHSTWEVEAMGSRPTSKGQIIKDLNSFAASVVPEPADSLYQPGGSISICVDWGTVAAGLEAWQAQYGPDGVKHVLIYCEQIEENGLTQIVGAIMGLVHRWPNEVMEVACDIGGGGNYLNPYLRNEHGINVRDVNFNMEKELAVAAWNIMNESGKTVIPEEFDIFRKQVRKWRRNNAGQIIKYKDHLCDTAVCYFAKFITEMGAILHRIQPQTFNTGSPSVSERVREDAGMTLEQRVYLGGEKPRVPLAASFGNRHRH